LHPGTTRTPMRGVPDALRLSGLRERPGSVNAGPVAALANHQSPITNPGSPTPNPAIPAASAAGMGHSVGAAAELAGGGVDQDLLAVGDVLRDHDLDAGAELGRLRALGRGAALQFRR